jgi:ceramide glucosyltransferase
MFPVTLGLGVLGLVTSTGFACIVLAAVPGYLRERRRALAQLQVRPGFTPPVTLLKPVHGAEPGLDAHLATFFEQDYPEFFSARARPRTQASRQHVA